MSIRLRFGVAAMVVCASAAAGCGSLSTAAPDGGMDVPSRADVSGEVVGLDVVINTDVPPGQDVGVDADTRACTVKINEVQTGGATALDEFIELYNTCPDRAFNLAGYTLVYRSATGASDFARVTFTTESIAAGRGTFVCANSGFSGNADARYTDGLAADGGGLALRGADGRLIDAVGWGTATNLFVETAPAPAPAASQSITRLPSGHDTDDNAHDFVIAAQPTPGAAN